MPRRQTRQPLCALTVRAEDCYDPADYVMVHKDYLAKLQRLERAQSATHGETDPLLPAPSDAKETPK